VVHARQDPPHQSRGADAGCRAHKAFPVRGPGLHDNTEPARHLSTTSTACTRATTQKVLTWQNS
jgi:hypothetical protein